MELVKHVLELGKKAKSVQNMVLVSSAGADYAERDKQPRLREFIDLEVRTGSRRHLSDCRHLA